MNYKFSSCSICDSEMDLAKKASELFSKFKNELADINLSIDDITVSYKTKDGYQRYITMS